MRQPSNADRNSPRGTSADPKQPRPDMSVVVPVNAQGDLQNVRTLLGDLDRYQGPHSVETVLLVNNYPPGPPPPQVSELSQLGVAVVAIATTRKEGEAIVFSARMAGIRAARADYVINFDADCRVPNPTALLNWYVDEFNSGAQAAYTRVGHFDVEDALSVKSHFAVHHAARWFKRTVLRIPTTRGSNYAVRRDTMLDLHERGVLADDLNVGPTFKRLAGRVAYSSGKELEVLTSGRMFTRGWTGFLHYFMYRLRYNLRVLPVRPGVAGFTGREKEPVSRYDYLSKGSTARDDVGRLGGEPAAPEASSVT